MTDPRVEEELRLRHHYRRTLDDFGFVNNYILGENTVISIGTLDDLVQALVEARLVETKGGDDRCRTRPF